MFSSWAVFISYFFIYSQCLDFEDNENVDGWVKPKSLFGDSSLIKEQEPINGNEIVILKKNLNDCKFDLADCNSNRNPIQTELQFFKRYISSIKRQFPILESENNQLNGHYLCDIDLSPSNYKYLTEFSEQSSSIEKIAILENIFSNIRWVENDQANPIYISEHNLEVLKIFVMILLSALIFVKVLQTFYFMNLSFYRIIFISLILMFIISIPWTWWHLYQKAKSKKMAEVFKGMPDSCNVEYKTYWTSFKRLFFSSQDECSRYFENIEVHPFLEVTPTMALSVTITRFVLEPAEYIGDAFRRFITATFNDLPFYLYLPVIVLMIIFFVMTMFTLNGYRFKTPLFSIEPYFGQSDKKLLLENEQLKKKLEQMESMKIADRQNIEIGAGDNINTIELSKIPNNKAIEIGAGDGIINADDGGIL